MKDILDKIIAFISVIPLSIIVFSLYCDHISSVNSIYFVTRPLEYSCGILDHGYLVLGLNTGEYF